MPVFAFEYWNRVWELLDSQGKSLKDLSEAIDVSYGVVRQWKTKNRYPRTDIQMKISSYLGTTIEYLMTGESASKKTENTSSDNYRYVLNVMNSTPGIADSLASLIKQLKGEIR